MPTIERTTAYSMPVSAGGTIPGDAATGHVKRDVRDWVENLAPQNTPILDLIMKNSRGVTPGTQAKLEWGSGANLPHNAQLLTSINTSATSVVVNSGQGARFQKWHKLALYQRDANGLPDISTKEIVVVTAEPSTDTLTVLRNQGGTNGSFTGGTTTTGAQIEIIGTAMPEGQDFTIAPVVFGDWYSNYYQLYQKSAKVTMEGNVTPNWEYSEQQMTREIRMKTMRLKLEMEKDIMQAGSGVAGNPTTPVASLMGGIDSFVLSGNTTNLGGARVTPYDIETLGASLWDSVADAAAKKLLMSMRTSRMFDGLMNKYREARMDDNSVSLLFKSFETRMGVYDIVPTRWVPEGVIYGVNFDNLSLIPYEGMNWQEKEHATQGPYRQRSIFGKFTLKVESPETMFKLYGFSTDINAYGRTF